MIAFRLLYRDESLVAIDKPPGFHSHPPEDPKIRLNPNWDCVRILERQLNQRVYPVHRLDRATSGVLLFASDRSLCAPMQKLFVDREVTKRYAALVRGRFTGEARIDRPLARESGSLAEAITEFHEWGSFQLPIPGPHGQERIFSLVDAKPHTGRFHQIRRHLAGIALPIVGDSRHGDKKLNREFAALTGLDRLFLRSIELSFAHPAGREETRIRAGWTRDWHKLFDLAGFCPRTEV